MIVVLVGVEAVTCCGYGCDGGDTISIGEERMTIILF